MKIKYVDPQSNCTVIQNFSSVHMDKVENENMYEFTFIGDTGLIYVFVPSYSLANEYMNTIYDTDKIDFSSDANVTVRTEGLADISSFQDFLNGLEDLDEDDLEGLDGLMFY